MSLIGIRWKEVLPSEANKSFRNTMYLKFTGDDFQFHEKANAEIKIANNMYAVKKKKYHHFVFKNI